MSLTSPSIGITLTSQLDHGQVKKQIYGKYNDLVNSPKNVRDCRFREYLGVNTRHESSRASYFAHEEQKKKFNQTLNSPILLQKQEQNSI